MVPSTLVVISIPASDSVRQGTSAGESALNDIEVGGEGGKAALERLRDVLGRKDSPWQPATAEKDSGTHPFAAFSRSSRRRNREREAIAKVFHASRGVGASL